MMFTEKDQYTFSTNRLLSEWMALRIAGVRNGIQTWDFSSAKHWQSTIVNGLNFIGLERVQVEDLRSLVDEPNGSRMTEDTYISQVLMIL